MGRRVDGYMVRTEDREKAEELFRRARNFRHKARNLDSEADYLEDEARRLLLGGRSRRPGTSIRIADVTKDMYLPPRG